MASSAAVAATEAKHFVTRNNQQIKRWSLDSLAAISDQLTDPVSERMVTPVAHDLASDIAVRLGAQSQIVQTLCDYVDQSRQKIVEGPQANGHVSSSISSSSEEQNKGGVICTSKFSQAYWWKEADKSNQRSNNNALWKADAERALEKARRNLRNLQILHESTFDIFDGLSHHLQQKVERDERLLEIKERKWMRAALRQVRDRHAMTVENVAEFVIDSRPYLLPSLTTTTNSNNSIEQRDDNNINGDNPFYKNKIIRSPLDGTVMNFLQGRFGVQLLCEHVFACPPGIVQVQCPLDDVLDAAIYEARLLCESHYSHLVTAAPEVHVIFQPSGGDDHHHHTIIRPWVHYVLVELLKNSMAVSMERAEAEFHENCSNVLPPSIYISIHDQYIGGTPYLTMDVFDQGGGFPANTKERLAQDEHALFDFVKTKQKAWDRLDDQQTYAMTRSPMRGLGVGLCLSRLVMEHFGGFVQLQEHTDQPQRYVEAYLPKELKPGCVASILLHKDLDHPEELYTA